MGQLTRERFVEMMAGFESAHAASDRIDKIIGEEPMMRNTRDFFSAAGFHLPAEAIAIELLTVMFDDTDNIIEYWICEKNFGRDWQPGDLVVCGKDVDLSDAGKLYDYISLRGLDIEEEVADE